MTDMPFDTLHRHGLLWGLVLVWAMTLMTVVTWVVFTDPPDIPVSTAAAYATVFGLPSVVFPFVQWLKDRRDGG